MFAGFAWQAEGFADEIVIRTPQNVLGGAVCKANDALAVEYDDGFRSFLNQCHMRFAGLPEGRGIGWPLFAQVAAHDGAANGQAKRSRRVDIGREAVFGPCLKRRRLKERIAGAERNDRSVRAECDHAPQEIECRNSAFADINSEGIDARME